MNTNPVNLIPMAIHGIAAFLVILVVIMGIQILVYSHAQSKLYDRNITQAAAEMKDIYTNQTKSITQYRWIDQEKGIVAIPVDRAIELIAND